MESMGRLYTYLLIYQQNPLNGGKYASPMDDMGIGLQESKYLKLHGLEHVFHVHI